MFNAENASQKWQPILEHADIPEIKDNYRKSVCPYSISEMGPPFSLTSE